MYAMVASYMNSINTCSNDQRLTKQVITKTQDRWGQVHIQKFSSAFVHIWLPFVATCSQLARGSLEVLHRRPVVCNSFTLILLIMDDSTCILFLPAPSTTPNLRPPIDIDPSLKLLAVFVSSDKDVHTLDQINFI